MLSYYKNPLLDIKSKERIEASEQIFLIDADGGAHNVTEKSKLMNLAIV